MKKLTRQVVGQAAPAATSVTDLYVTPAITETEIVGIIVCNRGATQDAIRIALCPDGEAIADKHYTHYDLPLDANDTITVSGGFFMREGDVIRVRSTTGNSSFSAIGAEEYPTQTRRV